MARNLSENDTLQHIKNVLMSFPQVEAAYLFGSYAKDRAKQDSDIDIALVVNQPLGKQKLAILAALTKAGIDNIDLVTLDTHDVTLKFEAVQPNKLIYARDTFNHGEYYSRVTREYFDFLPYLKQQREAMKRRLANS